MSRIRYIDTSAFVKYYGKPEFEKGVEKVEIMINEAREGDCILISSILMTGEAVSAFDSKSAKKEGLNVLNPEK